MIQITDLYSGIGIMATGADSEPSLSAKRLEGKVAIITGGAATGIGRAAVRLFVAHGAIVLFGDIQDKLGAELAQELAPHASFLHCDVTEESDVAALVDAAVTSYGRLDIMYNNAGIAGPRSLRVQDLDMAYMDFVYNVNIRGAILGTKHAARVMIPAKSGVILATASTASVLGGVEPVPHNLSRLAMAGLIRSASAELGSHGIRVNCISSSGTVWTAALSISEQREKGVPVTGSTQAGVEESTGRSALQQRRVVAKLLLPENVARAALFLASDDARFISGLDLLVDGDLVLSST